MKATYAILALIVAGAIAATGVSAFSGYGMGNSDAKTALQNGDYKAFVQALQNNVPNKITEEKFNQIHKYYQANQDIQNALDKGDYNAWVAAVQAAQPPKITDIITQSNFGKYVEMEKALKSGDFETAKKLAQELGLDKIGPIGMMHGHMERDHFY